MSAPEPESEAEPLVELAHSTPIERRGIVAGRLGRRWVGPLLGRVGIFDRAALAGERWMAIAPSFHLPSIAWCAAAESGAPAGATREEAAARAVFAALLVRSQITDAAWSDESTGEPVEKATYGSFFGTALVPFSRAQYVVRTAQTKHIVVLVRGRAFRVDLERRGESIGLAELVGAIESCVAHAEDADVAPCVATAASTGLWASCYERLAADRTNLASLRTIDAAQLVVCLDEGRPTEPYAIGRLAQAGALDNRWYTASLQLVVFANAKHAFVGSPVPGLEETQAVHFLDLFGEAHAQLPVTTVTPEHWRGVAPLFWRYPPGELAASTRLAASLLERDRGRHFALDFGAAQARRLGIPTTAALHLLVQAATAQMLGPRKTFRQLQLVSMRHATRGGLEMYDTVSPASLAFCAAMREGRGDDAIVAALRRATDDYRNTVFAIKMGMITRSPRGASRLGRLANRCLDRVTVVDQSSRWSVLPHPKTFSIFGRFGVDPCQPETWAHAFIGEDRTRILATEPQGIAVPMAQLQVALETVVARLNSLPPVPPRVR